jgi:hypothetical protein
MVPGSRNPMWGEEFNFSVDELPVQVLIMIYHPYDPYGCRFRRLSCGTILGKEES